MYVRAILSSYCSLKSSLNVLFIEKFFEYIERDLGEYDLITHLRDYADIDNTVDEFLAEFKKQYGDYLPETLQADLRLLMKNIRGFYLSKGTEGSYEFLFRTVFDTFIDFYYPKEDILRASDGTWIVPVYLFSDGTDFSPFFDKVLVGQTSGAEGYADLTKLLENPPLSGPPNEIGLRLISVDGIFLDNEVVQIKDDPGTTFTIDAVEGTIVTTGEWVDEKGFLSWNKYIQDSYYYQEYSYEITSSIGILDYKKVIDGSIHPAGMKLFAVVTAEDFLVVPMPNVLPVDAGNVTHANGYDYTTWEPQEILWRVISWLVLNTGDMQIIPHQMTEDRLDVSFNPVRYEPSHAFDYRTFELTRETARGRNEAYPISNFEQLIPLEFEEALSKYSLIPFIDGVKIHLDNYDIVNRDLSIPAAPAAGAKINALYVSKTYLPESFVATGAENVYSMSRIPTDEENILVFQNGLKLIKDIEYNIVEAAIGTLSIDEAWETEAITQDITQNSPAGFGLNNEGHDVSMDTAGLTMVSGAPSGSTVDPGKVFVSINTGNNTWALQQELVPTNNFAGSPVGLGPSVGYGQGVAISGDGNTVVVGCPGFEFDMDMGGGPASTTTGAGCIFVFTRIGVVWTQVAQLTVDGVDTVGGTTDWDLFIGSFGWSVNLSRDGNTMAISNPNFDNNKGYCGIYWNNGGVWTFLERITLAAPAVNDWNGRGALSDDGSALAIGVGGVDGVGTDRGSVKPFIRSGTLGTTYNTDGPDITSTDPADWDYFGDNVRMGSDGTRLFITCAGEDFGAVLNTGAIFYFERTAPGTWVFRQKIYTPDLEPYGWFAWYNLDISEDMEVLVGGAPWVDYGGGYYDNWGEIFIFGYDSGTNLYEFRLKIEDPQRLSDPTPQHRYGISVTVNGDGSIIGVGAESQDNPVGPIDAAGAVYTHEVDQTNVGMGGGFVLTDGLEIVATPTLGDDIEVIHLEDTNVPYLPSETFLGDGATTDFTLSSTIPRGKGSNVLVSVDGVVRQRGVEFDIRSDGKTIFFAVDQIPGIGALVDVVFLHNVDYENQTRLGNGTKTSWQLEKIPHRFPYVPINEITIT